MFFVFTGVIIKYILSKIFLIFLCLFGIVNLTFSSSFFEKLGESTKQAFLFEFSVNVGAVEFSFSPISALTNVFVFHLAPKAFDKLINSFSPNKNNNTGTTGNDKYKDLFKFAALMAIPNVKISDAKGDCKLIGFNFHVKDDYIRKIDQDFYNLFYKIIAQLGKHTLLRINNMATTLISKSKENRRIRKALFDPQDENEKSFLAWQNVRIVN